MTRVHFRPLLERPEVGLFVEPVPARYSSGSTPVFRFRAVRKTGERGEDEVPFSLGIPTALSGTEGTSL